MAAVKNGELLLSKEALKDLVRAVLEKKVPFRIRAKGFSMSPVIKDGDVIVITPLMDDQPGCGEVVAFLNVPNGTVAVHRVIKRSAGHYLIRGDNTRGPAETVTKERLLGRVKTVERNGKKVRFGLGPERFFIGYLNRKNLFSSLVHASRKVLLLLNGRSHR